MYLHRRGSNFAAVLDGVLYVPWKELEPTKGDYAFAAWEQKTWNTKAAQGKHIVLRVTIDYPSRPSGLPDWLRKEGVKETAYTEEGGGMSPNYDDPKMVAAMQRLIAALGKRYNTNPRVGFVQFGLLGFWGEWHTYPRTELFASDATVKKVIDAAHRAFPDKQLMNRYPTGYPGKQMWLGFFDDMFPEDTNGKQDWNFLPRLRTSKRQDAWKTVPIGGEMVPHAAERLLEKDWSMTMKRLEDAHFSWVGPYSPAIAGLFDSKFVERSQAMVRRMGYEYRLDEIRLPTSIRKGKSLKVEVHGTNQGVAPFYYRWPVELALMDPKGQVVQHWPVKSDLRAWLPGAFQFASAATVDASSGNYRLMLGIIDPWTKKPAIRFANKLPVETGWTELAKVQVRP